MNRGLSVYLDLLRFTAAGVVMLSHYSSGRLTGGLFWQFGGYGSQAVMVFFVLSGFVIAYTADAKHQDMRGFMKSRLARLYSVVIPALLLTLAVDAIGRHAAPDLYTSDWGYSPDNATGRLLMCLAFLNQIWNVRVRAFSDLPFWSLGYEFWYYVLFAVIFYMRGRRRTVAIAAIAILLGPAILMLLPIWWFGVWAYRWSQTHAAPHPVGWCLFIGSIGGFVVLQESGLHQALDEYFQAHIYTLVDRTLFPPTRNIVYCYLAACLATANIIGFAAIQDKVSGALLRWRKPIVYLAGLTFSLYLYHLPLLQVFAAIYGGNPSAWGRRVFILAATLLCVWALGAVTERKKHVAHQLISALEYRLGAARHAFASWGAGTQELHQPKQPMSKYRD